MKESKKVMLASVPSESSKILDIYLLIAQYPILAYRIRHLMRQELFHRGIITPERFEQEVREKALLSQQREGLIDPLQKEDEHQWEQRYNQVQEHLTDFYFAYNLPLELLHSIIDSHLKRLPNGNGLSSGLVLKFNPELAPLEMVLKQAEEFEALATEQRAAVDHHLQELIVVLLKSMISDQLAFIRIAKCWFTTENFKNVLAHRIGTGKIGGKAAGMLLAYEILKNTAPELIKQIVLPHSYFVGADVFYDFLAINHLEYLDQKYKSVEQIRAEYPDIQVKYASARFPEEIADHLREVLKEVGKKPLIVRSSSLLEDNFGTSFAGKYASFFCPNQGDPKENLRDLTLAIRRTYASVYGPDALMYRRRMGLLDYDERMAILIQEVQGQRYQQYYFPTLAGVACSYSPIVWNPRIRREEGVVRLVMGLGTRAVERVANDYPRLINLSHPQLRPEVTRKAVRYYSQHFMDLLDLEQNTQTTLPLDSILSNDFPSLRWLASVDDGDAVRPLLSIGSHIPPENFVLTFDNLLQGNQLVPLIKKILTKLSQQYQSPVEVEFVISLSSEASKPELIFHLLQCRPQNYWNDRDKVTLPTLKDIPTHDQLFLSKHMVPQGHVNHIEYIVYVDPESYHQLASPSDYTEVARRIGQLNKLLEGHAFILIGPGRWGSSDFIQGVPVTYADIFNTRVIVELTVNEHGYTSEPSYGTHFFRDLVETRIYPLALSPQDNLNWDFLRQATDQTHKFITAEQSNASCCIKVIHIPTERPGYHLDISMDGEQGLGYFTKSLENGLEK